MRVISGSRVGFNEGAVEMILIGRSLGDITEVPLGSYVGGNCGFIGDIELGLINDRGVTTKGTSEVSDVLA